MHRLAELRVTCGACPMGRGLGCRLLLSAPTPSEAWTGTAFLHLPSLSYCSVNTRKGRAGLWVAENGDRSTVCEGPGLPETWARKEEREAQILFWLGETLCVCVCVCVCARARAHVHSCALQDKHRLWEWLVSGTFRAFSCALSPSSMQGTSGIQQRSVSPSRDP